MLCETFNLNITSQQNQLTRIKRLNFFPEKYEIENSDLYLRKSFLN